MITIQYVLHVEIKSVKHAIKNTLSGYLYRFRNLTFYESYLEIMNKKGEFNFEEKIFVVVFTHIVFWFWVSRRRNKT